MGIEPRLRQPFVLAKYPRLRLHAPLVVGNSSRFLNTEGVRHGHANYNVPSLC